MQQISQAATQPPISGRRLRGRAARSSFRLVAAVLVPALALLAGCGSGPVTADPTNAAFSIAPGSGTIDTNCTGCNATSGKGAAVEQFTATAAGGGAASVVWSVSGGDVNSGAGVITAAGQYTPPSYLTADRVQVLVTAKGAGGTVATAVLTVTPGFLQPLTPENAALGANGQLTVTGYIAEAGGNRGISYALASAAGGASGGLGTLGVTTCQRSASAFTSCTVTYSAPAALSATSATWVVATVGTSASTTSAEILLNTAGVASNPAAHQAEQASAVALGASGGNNNDYDLAGNQIADCCGGTLGALVQDSNSRQYLLSNNHVLARSDHATVGDTIVQPGLIDNNCTPNGDGPGTTPVGTLSAWLPLSATGTNADAAIAQVDSGAVSAAGSILELGARQADGTLAAAPPGISSTGGKGEAASLALIVAKSGRSTGLTCGSISALALDISVDYYLDCAETRPYLSKTFTNQLAISGNQFTDSGDSGALVVDAANAEPVGLYFSGGADVSGVSQAVASPATDVLNELSAQAGNGATFTFVGAADHPVSCLDYGDGAAVAAQARTLSDAEAVRAQQALAQARLLVNPGNGILGVATGKSSDHAGEGAVLVYVDETGGAAPPATVDGVRTVVIPTSAHAVSVGSAPLTAVEGGAAPLPGGALSAAIAVKKQLARGLMKQNPGFFGVGVGQSLDNSREAALVVYVDRKRMPATLPATLGGMRTRYVVMDRLHVTRSYAAAIRQQSRCVPRTATGEARGFDPELPRTLDLQSR